MAWKSKHSSPPDPAEHGELNKMTKDELRKNLSALRGRLAAARVKLNQQTKAREAHVCRDSVRDEIISRLSGFNRLGISVELHKDKPLVRFSRGGVTVEVLYMHIARTGTLAIANMFRQLPENVDFGAPHNVIDDNTIVDQTHPLHVV